MAWVRVGRAIVGSLKRVCLLSRLSPGNPMTKIKAAKLSLIERRVGGNTKAGLVNCSALSQLRKFFVKQLNLLIFYIPKKCCFLM